jgi:hypothetical protein
MAVVRLVINPIVNDGPAAMGSRFSLRILCLTFCTAIGLELSGGMIEQDGFSTLIVANCHSAADRQVDHGPTTEVVWIKSGKVVNSHRKLK